VKKRLIFVLFPFMLTFCLVSLSGGFDNNKENFNPITKEPVPYNSGWLKGGHDTITAEGMLLKKEVHKGDQAFEDFSGLALPWLRIGAHDEDTNKWFNPLLNDPPIGKNGWGNFFEHFYNPETGEGFKGTWPPAIKRATDYLIEILKKMGCSPDLSQEDKGKVYDYFGRILHLLQDMGNPSHTKDDAHPLWKPFEDYVKDNWSEIVNSDAFKQAVTVDNYLKGNYGSIDPIAIDLIDLFARLSRNYFSEEELKDWVFDPELGGYKPVVNEERLMKNVRGLISEAVLYTAGYINAIYNYMGNPKPVGIGDIDVCKRPPTPSNPAGDHPDDRFDVSDEFYWEKEFGLSDAELTDFYLRTAIKKGKVGVWYKKRFMEIFIEGRTKYRDASQEVKDRIEAEFQTVGNKLSQRKNQIGSDWKGAPDIALFANGFYNPAISLMLKIGEPVSFQDINFNPEIVKDHPILLVPTGGFYGLKNSESVKALLGEYVKNGGTLVILSQQHGYDWELLPTPIDPETGERRPVTGYGYQEDQSCQFNSVYVDTYHPILSVFSTSAANIGVDGYFSSYPENSIILLRRVSNGQPAMIMYPYGGGHVIATTMYTDFALSHGQANQTEVNFIQNITSWAKKPADLIEINLGEAVNLNIDLTNFVDIDAVSAKFTILDPGKKVINEQTQNLAISAGQTISVPFSSTTSPTSVLGIYHVDYALYDSSGNVVQPQTETDSGRFVVSSPPSNPYKSPDFGFSVLSDAEYYLYGSPATFTFNLWNHTESERTITVKGNLSHHRVWVVRTVTVPPKGSTSFTYILEHVTDLDRCFTWFYDESGKQVGLESKGIWMAWPSANVTVGTDKSSYAYGKSETVKINASFKNNINMDWQSDVRITVTDANNNKWFEETATVNFLPFGSHQISTSFTLSPTAFATTYTVKAEVIYGNILRSYASARFEVPLSQISVTPNLPTPLLPGTNAITFAISNTGKISVSSGTIDLYLKSPGGNIVYSGTQPFSLAAGENNLLAIPVFIPSLEFGQYTLTYSQSDETKTGKPTSLLIPNTVSLAFSFDKLSYKVRDTANLTLDLTNSGKFNLGNGLITISAPSLGYTETKAAPLSPTQSSQLTMSIPVPGTISGGQHYVDVTLSVPSGTEFTQRAILTVPEPKLIIDYPGGNTVRGGDIVSLTIENQGGVDATYVTEVLSIKDSLGVEIYSENLTGAILAGEKKTLEGLKIPPQTLNGSVILNVRIKETRTGGKSYLSKSLEVNGPTASLETRTEKETYFKTEPITGISTLSNGPFGIENGSLNVAVKRRDIATQDEFEHFLPKEDWKPFSNPGGIAAAWNHVYVADTGNHRIQEFYYDGLILAEWGSYGNESGQFNSPSGIAVGPYGDIYVADTGNHRVQKFDGGGTFITQWGTYGKAGGQFDSPSAIAVDSENNVYVLDSNNNRLQKFHGDGKFITQWGDFLSPSGIAIDRSGWFSFFIYVADSRNYRIQKFDIFGNFMGEWGTYDHESGQFYMPRGIAAAPDGYVYVTDGYNRLMRYDSNGIFMDRWYFSGYGSEGSSGPYGIAVDPTSDPYDLEYYIYVATHDRHVWVYHNSGSVYFIWGSGGGIEDGKFNFPDGIATGPDGSIYVADERNHRIQKFSSDGNFITKWGTEGSEDGQLVFPSGIAVDSNGFVYVSDAHHRIQKFDSDGKFIKKWGHQGSGDGEFYYPMSIAIGQDGSIYVADTYNYRIQRFDSNGNFVTKWGSQGGGEGQFDYPWGIAVGPDGSVYVADDWNDRIQKFDSNGNFITKWGGSGIGDGQFSRPWGIAVSRDGFVYVADFRIQKFDSSGNFIAKWGGYGIGDGEFYDPAAIALSTDGTVYVADWGNHRIQKMEPSVLFETSLPINQPVNGVQDYSTNIGQLNITGKLYLEGRLFNSLGQTFSKAVYPFYITEGNTIICFNTDKKVYKPGETVTISGEIKNFASIEALNLVLDVRSALGVQSPQTLYTENLNIPAGGSHAFVVTRVAGAEGVVTLTGNVSQNNSTLVEITDRYEVRAPAISVTVFAPDIVGNEPFFINVEIRNTGKVEETVQLGIESTAFADPQAITISPGEIKLVQYAQQLTTDMNYTFTFSGDLNQSITKTVFYGLSASLQLGAGLQDLGVYPEGKILIPLTITNTGQLDETLEVRFELSRQSSILFQQSKTYFILKGTAVADSLFFDLTEGNYQITVSSQSPTTSNQANFFVGKENKIAMGASSGPQANGLIPVTVDLSNQGYNSFDGRLVFSVIGAQGTSLWSSSQDVSLPSSVIPTPFTCTSNIDPSAIAPANYTVRVDLVNNSGELITFRSLPLVISGPVFRIAQPPGYQTFYPGQEANFTFKVQNTGNQEGSCDLDFRVYDLIESMQREWLKPGEEKSLTFSFVPPEDLEEKDYFASYELKDSNGIESSRGQIKYHLAGISLNVNATLDKSYYGEGETAHLTLNIQSTNPNPQSFFARVNYNGSESQQPFMLSGSQAILFDIPLTRITGEKLFYGIYHASGRSVHLNSLYIHKQGDVLTITTDKQVYNPGEIVSVSVSGSASGNMTLSGPGGYEETFALTGSVTRLFPLPVTMAAGTYYVNAQLVASNPGTITISHPFDVAGIQVKVLECQNDNGKYASSDTITTNFTIFSNKSTRAVLKAWIVDPKGQYNLVGEQGMNLSSSENLSVTLQSSLITTVSGIHRLIYGVYSGDLLLVSGSEAFDVGDAVLLGISTDKKDYSTNTEPVNVTLGLFGSVNADLQLELDGSVVKGESITLSGFLTYKTQLQNITPGPHILKGTLTAGGLKDTKEISFTYALAYVPKPKISASPSSLDFGPTNLSTTSTKTATLSSAGNVDLIIGTISLSGAAQGEFSLVNDNCSGRTIVTSGSCTVDVVFLPTFLGAKTASLSIPSNAINTPTLNLSLVGTGVTTLNVSINPVGSGKVTGAGIDCPGDCVETYNTSGATVQLTAAPSAGYQFKNWTGDITQAQNPVTVSMDTNRMVAANFVVKTYTITATATFGGTILPSGSVSVSHGGSQIFIIAPNLGNRVTDVKVDGASVGAVTVCTLSDVTAERTIEAFFTADQYTITATAGLNGAIFPSGTLLLNYGASQAFTIIPDAGYHVADVKVDGVFIGAVTTFTFDSVTSNRSIEVTFAIDNLPPVADAGPDQNVVTGTLVTLSGKNSYDPEGAMITFFWIFIEVPAGSPVTLSDATSAKPEFTPVVDGTYRIKLIVNDGVQDSVPDEVVINAATPNVRPNANAGPDQSAFTGITVQLDGSKSNDPDNGPLPLSYLWSFAAKPAGSGLTDNDIANRNMANAGFVPDVGGLYELKLTVNDGDLSSEDTVQVMVTTPNVPPNANAGEDISLWLGEEAVLDGSASNDPDNGPQPLSYTWTFVTVPAGSQIGNANIADSNTVHPRFKPDVEGTYVLQLMVSDSVSVAFDNVAVTARKPQIPPTTTAALSPLPNASGWNKSNVTGTLSATDNGGSGVKEITYAASGAQPIPNTTVAGPSASFVISTEGRTTVTFFASDNGGNIETPKSVVINLDKTPPNISCSASPSLLWPANHKMVTITVSVNLSDPGSGAAGFKLMSVTSNEPDNGLGDGDTPNDIQGWSVGTADISGQLRAERSGKGAGRQYTLTYAADDVAGNRSTCTTVVIVPHDKGK